MKMRPIVLLALTVLVGGASLQAQEEKKSDITTLLIQDGRVYVNGRAVEVPSVEGETLESVEENYFQATFFGKQPIIFPIGQHWYRFQENKIVPHMDVRAGEPAALSATQSAGSRARRSEEIYRETVDRYFRQLQQQDRRLAIRLSAEQQMEYEARSLAARIRATDNDKQQVELTEQLEQILGRILDIKQENRSAEIRELEERLKGLKLGLQKRQEMRAELIEARMQELLQQH